MTYSVREPRVDELFKFTEIGRRVLEESPTYTNLSFDEKKTANLLYGAIVKQQGWWCMGIYQDDEPIGGLICYCFPALFSQDKVAEDITIMLDEECRGKCVRQIKQVVEMYKEWALKEGAKIIKFGVSSGINMDKASTFLESKMGFTRVGAMHALIVGE